MLRCILYVVSRSNGRIWTGCRFHSLSSSPQMQHLPSNVDFCLSLVWFRWESKGRSPIPPENTWNFRTIGKFDTIAQPMRYEKSLRILQWHQKSPAIFARRRKSIPCLIFYKYVLCTFIHQKVRHDFDFGSIDLETTSHKQTNTSRPFTMVLHSYHADSDSPIHDQELAETFRALHNNKD